MLPLSLVRALPTAAPLLQEADLLFQTLFSFGPLILLQTVSNSAEAADATCVQRRRFTEGNARDGCNHKIRYQYTT